MTIRFPGDIDDTLNNFLINSIPMTSLCFEEHGAFHRSNMDKLDWVRRRMMGLHVQIEHSIVAKSGDGNEGETVNRTIYFVELALGYLNSFSYCLKDSEYVGASEFSLIDLVMCSYFFYRLTRNYVAKKESEAVDFVTRESCDDIYGFTVHDFLPTHSRISEVLGKGTVLASRKKRAESQELSIPLSSVNI